MDSKLGLPLNVSTSLVLEKIKLNQTQFYKFHIQQFLLGGHLAAIFFPFDGFWLRTLEAQKGKS